MNFETSLEFAKKCDQEDELRRFRDEFAIPDLEHGKPCLYFAGHSLGLRPNRVVETINKELEDWKQWGVEGHFKGTYPWLPYHENITESFSKLVGAKQSEVVAMNTLTVNLHMMMVSFYRPTKSRYKILIENNTFPSDKYAVDSQARFHGFPKDAIVELTPREGEMTIREEDLISQIENLGDSLALVMLGNCNYLSGQAFPIKKVTDAGHKVGATVGFNLAHGAGNLVLNLHDDNVDFAVWCSYKYLNSGPGGLAGAFVHEKHHNDPKIPRFEGWWGNDKSTRFKMGPDFEPIASVEAWQLSNPPIFQLASLRASMQLFDEATMPKLRAKGDRLTSYLEYMMKETFGERVSIITPASRGSMLCMRFKADPKVLVDTFGEKGVIADFREPDIIRMCPAPLYNNFEDIYHFVQIVKEVV